MNDPRSSNGRGGDAKQATTTVSDLGTEQGEWKDLGEVSRGQQDIPKHPLHPPPQSARVGRPRGPHPARVPLHPFPPHTPVACLLPRETSPRSFLTDHL